MSLVQPWRPEKGPVPFPVSSAAPFLAEESALLFDATRRVWLRFERPQQVLAAYTLDAVLPTLAEVERQVAAGRGTAVGFVAYEAAPAFDPALQVRPDADFPRVWFGLYDAPTVFDFPPPPAVASPSLDWTASVSDAEYRAAVAQIKHYIAQGDTYQVNYSYRLRAPWNQAAWPFFVCLTHAQACAYGALLRAGDWLVACASPELFFQLDGRRLISRPMKGTVARGLTQADDLQQAAWLRGSEKNRAENVMIVDMVRNDVGRVAASGSVAVRELCTVEKYPSLWQMTSTVEGTTDAGLVALLRAMFPAASITGAPKARTMQIIAALETSPRRVYTGTIGYWAPGRSAQFNVAIRTVLVDLRRGLAEYGVGGGIVWDSTPADEWEECRTKARVLTHVAPSFDLLETLRWSADEGFFLREEHLARLADTAAYFSRPLDLAAVGQRLEEAVRSLHGGTHRVRVLVGGQGAVRVECQPLRPLPAPYRVRLAAEPVSTRDPFLYHKTTHRGVYARALAGVADCDDVLLWNERGELTESTIANLVIELDGRLLTPPVTSGLLPGIARVRFLAEGRIAEQVLGVDDLRRAARVYLLNAVRGMWRVTLADAEGGRLARS
jgi:para-aminobenzoate synthetase/4-amino-4-deoxychorismate lyase